MRRGLTACLAALALGVAGVRCGDDAGGPLAAALAYLPADSEIVVILETDLGSDQVKGFERTLGRLVLDGRSVEATLREDESLLQADDGRRISFDRDVKPLLGDELVAGLSPAFFNEREDEPRDGLVAAWKVRDEQALRRLLPQVGYKPVEERDGATLFREEFAGEQPGERTVAVEDGVLVVTTTERGLDAALARADGDGGLREETVAEALAELRGDALLRVVADPAAALADGRLPALRELPWVGALRSVGAVVSFEGDTIVFDAGLRTDPARVSDADLPLPPGEPEPALPRRTDAITGASANQSQTTRFLLRALRAARPEGRFVRDVAKVERAYGIDFERDVLAQFDGPSASALRPGDERFAARSTVRDPAEMERTLRRLAPDLGRLVQDLDPLRSEGLAVLLLFAPDAPVGPGVLGRGRIEVERIEGERALYRMANLRREEGDPRSGEPDVGPDRIVFGLIGETFVVASDLDQARAIAREPLAPVKGLRGASVAHADLFRLRRQIGERADDFLPVGPGLLRPGAELRVFASASRERVRATARLRLP